MLLLSAFAAPLGMAPPSDGTSSSPFMSLIPLVFIMFIFYFLVIRPQQRRHKEHQDMVKSLSRGDRVLTNGGMYATVVDVKDDLVVATIAEGVKVELAKSAVAGKVALKGKSDDRNGGKSGGKGKSKSKDTKEDEASA